MRVRSTGLIALLAVLGMASSTSGSGASRTAMLKIPLPPPDSVQVSEVTVTATAPKGKAVGALKLAVKNQKALGSPQTNTQVVAAVTPKSSKQSRATFKVWLFVHRFAPVPQRRRTATAAQESDYTLIGSIRVTKSLVRFGGFVVSQSCAQLAHEKGVPPPKGSKQSYYNFLGDTFGKTIRGEGVVIMENLVFAFDTPAEEQVDNAVFSKPCPGAENPADDPPPV